MIFMLQAIAISLGLFFLFTGTVGLIRMPDVYTRMHATTKCDTVGVGLVVLGLMLSPGNWINVVKLGLVLVFLWVCNPTVSHLIAQAAWLDGSPMYGISDNKGELGDD